MVELIKIEILLTNNNNNNSEKKNKYCEGDYMDFSSAESILIIFIFNYRYRYLQR